MFKKKPQPSYDFERARRMSNWALGVKTVFAAALYGFSYFVEIPRPSGSPEDVLRGMGYDPELIHNMPDGRNVKVFTDHQILTKFFYPDLKLCDPSHSRLQGGKTSYIELSDEGCEPVGVLKTQDGKSYNFFDKENAKLEKLYVLFHEWRHRKNSPWATHISETDSDIQSIEALEDLGFKTDSFREQQAQRRAIRALYALDYDHNSALALYFNVKSEDPKILKAYVDRTFSANLVLSAELFLSLKGVAQNLVEFRDAVEDATHELEKSSGLYSQQKMLDIKILSQLVISGADRMLAAQADNSAKQSKGLLYEIGG